MIDWLPFTILLLAQLLAVIGDIFGQRATIVYWRRRKLPYMLSMTLHTGFQFLIFGTVIQLWVPSLSASVPNGPNECYRELDVERRMNYQCTPQTCQPIECPRQGPLNMFKLATAVPFLWATLLVNFGYYLAQTTLFTSRTGVVLMTTAIMLGGFLIPPFEKLLGIGAGSKVSLWSAIVSSIGAILTVCRFKKRDRSERPLLEGEEDEHQRQNARRRRTLSYVRRVLLLAVPFLAMIPIASFYFVLQKRISLQRINTWAFNAFDQICLPMYMWPLGFIVGLLFHAKGSFKDRVKVFLQEVFSVSWRGHLCIFLFRISHNLRSVIRFVITSRYAVSEVFYLIELAGSLFSWLGTFAVVLFAPKWLGISPEQRQEVLSWGYLVPELIGSMFSIAAVIMIENNV